MSCCCGNTDRCVVANSAVTTPTANPVVLTINNPLPVGCCFWLCISKGLLVNANPNLINLTVGGTTYTVWNQCADQVRYDQLICKAKSGCAYMDVCQTLRLCCSVRPDTTDPRVLVITDLPQSSYTPVQTTTT